MWVPLKGNPWDFSGGSVVKTVLSIHEAQVQSLVRELRSHMLHSETKENKGATLGGACIWYWPKKIQDTDLLWLSRFLISIKK